jgi:hypothetical protein
MSDLPSSEDTFQKNFRRRNERLAELLNGAWCDEPITSVERRKISDERGQWIAKRDD